MTPLIHTPYSSPSLIGHCLANLLATFSPLFDHCAVGVESRGSRGRGRGVGVISPIPPYR